MRVIFGLIVSLVSTAALAAEVGPVAEAFGCNLRGGKTMADFDAAVAGWQGAAKGIAALDSYGAATLVPIRANSPYDLLWLGVQPNLNAWAKAVQPGSEAERAALARLDEAVACESGLFLSAPLRDALAVEESDNEAVVETYACTLNDGKTMADLAAAHAAYAKAGDALSAIDPGLGAYNAVQWTPYLANVPYDVAYFVVFDDLDAWARSNTAFRGSPEGAASDAAFGQVIDCEAGLWRGTAVHRAKAQ
jgi:hypothetical protein